MAGLSPAAFSAFGRGGFSPSTFKPAAPKPPGMRGAGRALLGAGGLTHPSVGGAGSALLGGAANLTQPQAQQQQPPPAPAQPAATPDPADSTYYANVNQYLFNTGQKINADTLQQGQDRVALQNALGQLAYQQPRDQLALEQKANNTGGLYSSVYGQNASNLVHNYATRQTAAQNQYQGDIDRLAMEIAGLQGSIPTYESSQYADAVQRAAAAAQANPALGFPPPAPAPAAAAPAGGQRRGGGGRPTGPGSALLSLAGRLSGRKR